MRPSPLLAVVASGLLMLTSCAGESEGPRLSPAAAIPEQAPEGTVLRIGDPMTEVALEESGLIEELDGIDIEFANLSGGPETLEAFRGDALDAGSVADIPPLFAQWTGTEVGIVAVRETIKPLDHPVYEMGVAPGVDATELADLEGKRIAYSPGQAQGALVLRALNKAGLSKDDVELVEMQSVDDSFVNALAGKQVDVAPLSGTLLRSYLAKYERDGASSFRAGIRDDAWTLYAPVETLRDAHKAAALREYVSLWPEVVQWINEHPDEFAQAYYMEHEGLTRPDADYLVRALGKYRVPSDWGGFMKRHQATADLLAEEQGHEKLDIEDIYDVRYEDAAADRAEGDQ